MCRNIRQVFDNATTDERREGMGWYLKAHVETEAMASKYRFTTAQTCGVIAALSPGRQWDKNLEDAETLLNAFKRGLRRRDLPLVGSYGWRNVEKAENILLSGEPLLFLSGPKTRAFYQCLVNPWKPDDRAVCVDRHAFSVAFGARLAENQMPRDKAGYERVARAYRRTSDDLQLAPHVLQAITWISWRNNLAAKAASGQV
jgi:hypothetical protein